MENEERTEITFGAVFSTAMAWIVLVTFFVCAYMVCVMFIDTRSLNTEKSVLSEQIKANKDLQEKVDSMSLKLEKMSVVQEVNQMKVCAAILNAR